MLRTELPHASRDFDAQHLRVRGLALPVGAAYQPERPPLVRRDLAALVSLERRHELVDVGDGRKRQPRAAVRVLAGRMGSSHFLFLAGYGPRSLMSRAGSARAAC